MHFRTPNAFTALTESFCRQCRGLKTVLTAAMQSVVVQAIAKAVKCGNSRITYN